MLQPTALKEALARPGRTVVCGAPEGVDALVLADAARLAAPERLVHVARDEQRMTALAEFLAFFAPDVTVLRFPAWDCLPYDRVSPAAAVVAERLATLARLQEKSDGPMVVLTTVNAVLQRTPTREVIARSSFSAKPGQRIETETILAFLAENGFSRTGTVVDPGDYAVRGGLIDIYPPGVALPVRLDFFGDTLEAIRTFDPETQRSIGQLKSLELDPASEVLLTPDSIGRFRTGYAAAFGGIGHDDPLYESVTGGRRYSGMEHWLPLFHERLETLFDHAGPAAVCLDPSLDEAAASRQEQIGEFFDARRTALGQETFGAPPYKPLPPDGLYLRAEEWTGRLGEHAVLALTPFEVPSAPGQKMIDAGGRQGRTFAAERSADGGSNLYDAVRAHLEVLKARNMRPIIAAWSEGSRERLETILKDHEVRPLASAASWTEALSRPRDIISTIVLRFESGFETDGLAIIAEQDILGDRLVRRVRKARKITDLVAELASFTPGDLVVHGNHGIGRFEGLKSIEVQGAPHDCLYLTYAGGDRLFLPVENIELVSRYGSDEAGAQLDKLGGVAWQARKARLKQRVREIASQLIRTAAERALKQGEVIAPTEGLYDEFCARFPFEETDDQLVAVEAVLEDLQSGRPMDRLICGDVGFGKTEVALRAAFVAAMAGKQVAVVAPTTLLARQHFATFSERFRGLPVRISQLSRLVGRKEAQEVRDGLASGQVDIVVGTHALLASSIKFRDLGLLIIDEEQHFGVKHKERLKELRAEVHVLTLTATPIPRTLQLALSGVRELSIIATPPLDRLAVRTFISPFDPVVIREMLLREHFRGGQSFYVVPRISDLGRITEFLTTHVPEVKFRVGHGQLPPTELEDIMSAFYERQFDVLVSTTIVESGLDIPTANTLIVDRADKFGLSQLYQLRGRVGRSKLRAYALFTVPADRMLTPTAEKRLKVLQSLDSLGAGFSLASHDLDIRGAGNLLGEEQSGHIREVGFELYQAMLEEAVSQLRTGATTEAEEAWSPQINIGTAVMIPESFVPDLQLRMGLYRRLADLKDEQEIDAFGAELRDRFGPVPDDVNNLLDVVRIKLLCRQANVASIDSGPKGAVIGLKDGVFPNPEKLVSWITEQGSRAKLRPDMKIVVMRDWPEPDDRLKGVRRTLSDLVRLAA